MANLAIYQKDDFTNSSLMNSLFGNTATNSSVRNQTFTLAAGAAPERVVLNDTNDLFESGAGGGPLTGGSGQTVTSSTNSTLYPNGMNLRPVQSMIVSAGGVQYKIYTIAANGNASGVVGIAIPDGLAQYLKDHPTGTITVANSNALSRPWDAGSPTYESLYCFAADAMIDTDRGAVAAGALIAGDVIKTRDGGLQPIRWVGQRHVDAITLATAPKMRPIRIKAGALGGGMPIADLIVSPQHRVLVRSKIAQKMFGTNEVLVAAKQLCQLDGIDVADDVESVTYVHFMFDDHQIVYSNGAETESLFTGPEALKAVGPDAREEIFSIFPDLLEAGEVPSARPIAQGKMARKLAERHMQNQKPLLM